MSSKEFFVTARSFAAPFVSDTSEKYVVASSPQAALESFLEGYGHPCGCYAAECWPNADAFHKKSDPLARWQSYKAQQSLIEGEDPKSGSFV